MEVFENKCPKCGKINKYDKSQYDLAVQEMMDSEKEVVIRAGCTCGYFSELYYKQIV
jgi:predicted nucleic-acid-binding Zn-ribbon protein